MFASSSLDSQPITKTAAEIYLIDERVPAHKIIFNFNILCAGTRLSLQLNVKCKSTKRRNYFFLNISELYVF